MTSFEGGRQDFVLMVGHNSGFSFLKTFLNSDVFSDKSDEHKDSPAAMPHEANLHGNAGDRFSLHIEITRENLKFLIV